MIILPALLGLALCLLKATGTDLFCLTTGCAVYSGYSLFGLSFSTFGAVGFGGILLLALRAKKKSRTRDLLGGIIHTGLALDILFLGWQILYWPCSSCLVVALLLGWAAFSFQRSYPQLQRRLYKGVLIVWLGLLIPVTMATGKEILLRPWAIYGPENANISVFFSPTCPACKTEVSKLLQSPEAQRMAFYPIAKNDRDLRLLATLQQEGVAQPADLGRLFSPELKEATGPPLSLRWRLAKNKMALARYGALTIPFILSSTVLELQPAWINPLLAPTQSSEATGCGTFAEEKTSCE